MARKVFSGILTGLLLLLAMFVPAGAEDAAITRLDLYGDLDGMYEKSDVRSVAAFFTLGDEQISCHATVKIQGNTSLSFDKKNYTIKFYADAAHEQKLKIDLGWGAQSKYCLKANWIDRTHSRNIVTARLASQVQQSYNVLSNAPCNGLVDGFPVEIYVNGQFHGLYTWNIPKDAWAFGMDTKNENHILMCCNTWEEDACFAAHPTFESWEVEEGEESEQTLAKLTRLFQFVMDSDDKTFRQNFSQYMDLDAALNYYILVDFCYLPDNCGKNMLLATYDGEIWYPSLYDLDTSWGTDYLGETIYDYQNNPIDFAGTNLLAKRLEENFPQELHNRYFALRQTLLTKEHVMSLFHEFRSQIPAETFTAEAARWGGDIPGFYYSQIERYLDIMIPLLDEKYSQLGA